VFREDVDVIPTEHLFVIALGVTGSCLALAGVARLAGRADLSGGLVGVAGICLFLGFLAVSLGVIPRPAVQPAALPTPEPVATVRDTLAAVVGVAGVLVWQYRSSSRRPAAGDGRSR
jgi:hypothetical protein